MVRWAAVVVCKQVRVAPRLEQAVRGFPLKAVCLSRAVSSVGVTGQCGSWVRPRVMAHSFPISLRKTERHHVLTSAQLVRARTTFYYWRSSWLNKGLVNTSYMSLLLSGRFFLIYVSSDE